MKSLFISLSLVLFLGTGLAQTMEHSISVSGQGIEYGEPDLVVVEMGINVNNQDAATATAQANGIIEDIRTALLAFDIENKDIRTSQFNIWPDQRYDNSGNPTETTFRVNHILSITVRDIDSVGDVLAESINSGANSVNNIRYTFADSKELQKAARASAMEAAKDKAQQLADLAGVTLGKVIQISEGSSGGGGGGIPMPVARMAFANEMADSVPVSGGQLAVQVNLFVVFDISE